GGVTSIIIVESKDWIPGVLGLIASKLVDTYYRPVVAISVGEELSRASARSIPEFNMVEALRGSGDLFTKYGGHPQAAGFTIPTRDLPEIKRSLQSSADSALRDANLAPFISVECEVAPAIFVGDNFSFIQSLSPFGEGNPAPLFLTRSARVVDARQVGNGGNHLKMRLWHDGAVWDAIAFRQGSKVGLTRERIDLVYTIGLDTWGSVPKLQLTVQDFRKAR
ncbi:MAG: DHH family phosphoesterase, partial [Chloroflexi bacterium]|nr:DHH family phosphoesterase [Chloroflexota bacterium]